MDTPVRWAVGFVIAVLIVAMLVFLRGAPIGPHPSHPIAVVQIGVSPTGGA